MARQEPSEAPQSPGVINSVAAGFELATSHLWLLILPVILDLLLWLGPRLTVAGLLRDSLALLPQDDAFAQWSEQILALAPRTNLLTSLSFPVIGVPALMTGPAPERTPIATQSLELQSLGTWMLVFLGLNLLGIVLGAVYFNWLAQPVRPEPLTPDLFVRRTARTALRLCGLVLLFVALSFALGLALIPLVLLVAFLGLGATAVALIGGVLGLWLVIYFSFSLHGMVLHQAGVLPALIGSVRLIQRHMWPTLLLLAAVVLISSGLNSLWRMVDDGSWLHVISIAGHAFITTGLLLGTLLYYRARTAGSTPSRISVT